MVTVVASFILGLMILLNVIATIRIARSDFETSTQKTVQILLIWLVPFIGSIIVISVNKGAPSTPRRRPFDSGSGGTTWLAGIGPESESSGVHHGAGGEGDGGHGGDTTGGGH